ncbi:hypothetical protein ACLE93_17325 [Enterobacter hormaechei]|uniref:hypothetical protein n=1 Tax=Enterobacter hormaechei TaxID=158836 RepID=UPI0039812CF9
MAHQGDDGLPCCLKVGSQHQSISQLWGHRLIAIHRGAAVMRVKASQGPTCDMPDQIWRSPPNKAFLPHQRVTKEGKDMFNSIEEAMQFMSHFSSTLELSAKDKMIIAKDLYLNAENEKEAIGIVKKWTD